MHFRIASSLIVALALSTQSALAVRPFITDDARVVGDRAVQVETWVRFDKRGLQHWVVPAFGPLRQLELSAGAVYGVQDGKLGAALPLLQLKVLALETKTAAFWPGLAFVVGTFGPYGVAPLKGENWDTFGYLALTESLADNDRILVHQNLGGFVSASADGRWRSTVTWGVGTQIHVIKGLHAVAEIFAGDPYAGTPTSAFQVGGRYFVSSIVQVDATFGHGLWGESILPAWGSVGLRVASNPGLW